MNALKWIPFKVGERDARLRFLDYHRRGWLGADVQLESSQKLLMPFYAFNVDVDTFTSAQLPGGQPQDIAKHHLRHRWSAFDGDKAMQIYASRDFNRSLVNDVVKGDLFLSTSWEDMPTSYGGSDVISALPFSVDPVTALQRYISPFVQSREEKRAQKFVHHKYQRSLPGLTSFVKWSRCSITPCYVPVHVFRFEYAGTHYFSFVDGVLGRCSGPRIIDAHRFGLGVASAAAIATLPSLWPVVTLKSLLTWSVTGALIPYVAGLYMGRLLPELNDEYQTRKQEMNYGMHSFSVEEYNRAPTVSMWDLENAVDNFWAWQKEIGSREEAAKWAEYQEYLKETGQSEHSSRHNIGAPRHPDLLGYYEIFGLRGREATATTEDIQQLFKSLASRYHPDRQSTLEKKDEAAAIFQQLSLAYSVLRDERLRKEYDRPRL